MKIAFFIFSAILFISCNKKTAVIVPYSEASYKVVVSIKWVSPAFNVPPGAHITGLIGMIHRTDTSLWIPGMFATEGLEDVAEIGNNDKMNAQLDAIITNNKALSKFTILPPAITGTVETNLAFNSNYPAISFASMIAPSPDWFIGINNFSLLQDNEWINDITLNLMVYDAGTEDGDVFGYTNPDTSPHQNIALLTAATGSVLANGNTSLAALGTIRFVKN